MLIEETIIIKKNVYVSPCIKCGSDNINIFDYGYGTSNYGGGRCKDCKNEITEVVCVDPNKKKLIDIWNKKNDITLLLLEQDSIINKANKEIIRLTEILNKRNKNP
jgi:hypothetical protein